MGYFHSTLLAGIFFLGNHLKVEREAQNIIQPGSIVEWLKAKGIWIVQATTGIVAKIRDSYGKEVLVNCQELNKHLCQTGLS
jgi:hypothetical protein